ncbi:histidinol phosphate phosphatase [Burkholderia stabilis]|nr:histidinol phosphate phosphatase [Burkholderia stabilis]HDR9494244.1 H-NS histone family protein [Burkholderia stabilis]HDR9525585.1 H-NS histone family protein [Burkholderia stabilis]HDR9531829.1 H-NS histone family protein [Burkholderia stabilis]HDR9541212.1 H-NS histone family protein [Burkholderia stabilis]
MSIPMRMRGRKQKMSASKTYAQLVVELAELDEEIERARARERIDAIEKVHSLMDTYAIKHRDLVGRNGRRGAYMVKVLPARYRDPVSGKEWSGRGNAPLWIRGKDRRQFVICKPPSAGKKARSN